MVQQIVLTGGHVALVDDDDFIWASAHAWHLGGGHASARYAARTVRLEGRRTTTRYLHREIARPGAGLMVDHVNGDALDNRRANLRVVTDTQNKQNQTATNGRIGVRGVSWNRQHKRYRAQVWIARRRIHLGYFRALEDAAVAVAEGRRRYYVQAQEHPR